MWWEVVFWLLLVPILIILGIIYGTGKKLYKLLYVLTIYTYITLATYIIDVFQLGRNWILSILIFSAILLIIIGYFMSKNSSKKKVKKKKKTQKYLVTSTIILVLMLALIILGSSNSGLTKKITVVSSINASFIQTVPGVGEKKIPPDSTHKVMTITYENNGFLPAPISENRFSACAYDADGKGYELFVETEPSSYKYYEEVQPGQTKDLLVNLGRVYSDEQGLKKVIIASFNHDAFHDCSELKSLEKKATIFEEIPVVE